jgi:hypothetical protein
MATATGSAAHSSNATSSSSSSYSAAASAAAKDRSASAGASSSVAVPAMSAAPKPATKIDDKKKDKEKDAKKKIEMPKEGTVEYATIQQKIKQRGALHDQLQQLEKQQKQAVADNSSGVPAPSVSKNFHEQYTLLKDQRDRLDSELAEYGIQGGQLPAQSAQKPVAKTAAAASHYHLTVSSAKGRTTKSQRRVGKK